MVTVVLKGNVLAAGRGHWFSWNISSLMRSYLITFLLFTMISCASASEGREIRIPAFTAYLDPNANAAHVGPEGISGWNSPDAILWGGVLAEGELTAGLSVLLPPGSTAKLNLAIDGHAQAASITGSDKPVSVDFGSFTIPKPGYHRIELTGVTKTGKTFGDVKELILSGPAAEHAFFNLKPRRNCAIRPSALSPRKRDRGRLVLQ